MKLINSSYEILEPLYGIEGVYKEIERAGRLCYKSEDKITDNSCYEFVGRMVNSGHHAMLEHGTVYLKLIGTFLDPKDSDVIYGNYLVSHYINNKYSKVIIQHDENWKSNVYITTNYRVLLENGWLDDLQYMCEPTEYHEKRIGVKFICDRGVSHELVRNRGALGNAFAQESTRYCNYSKDKFGNELTFIIPSWINMGSGKYEWEDQNPLLTAGVDIRDCGYDDSSNLWVESNGTMEECKWARSLEYNEFFRLLQTSENIYNILIKEGWKPQQARAILPNALKTEIIVTGFISDWEHFFELRDSKAAHPDMYALAHPLHGEFKKLNYVV